MKKLIFNFLLVGVVCFQLGVSLQYNFSFMKIRTPTFGKVHNFDNPAVIRLDYQGGFVEYFISIDIRDFQSSGWSHWQPVEAEIFRRKSE